ncbi:hypothetical protein AX760_25350 [Pararhizobium antarcticum]|uniref:Uncharacterized protein n=1 Tax=Pararhizobium antarcticum TaxID=1798805 RepID=A0A657LYT9_9HYPH|nr:hypothetical protein AX760_25350 [Pararhizobium antarcticum]
MPYDRECFIADFVVYGEVVRSFEIDPLDAATQHEFFDVNRTNRLQFDGFQILVGQEHIIVLDALVPLCLVFMGRSQRSD